MAGKWIEGFETHTATNQLGRKYATMNGTVSVQAGRVHGNSVSIGSNVQFVTPSLGLATSWVLGFGMRIASNTPSLNSNAQGWYIEKGANEQLHLEVESSAGSFELRVMRGATEIAKTSETFGFGVWHYFELKVTVDDTVGAYELRHNEVNVLSGTGVNLADDTGSQADILAWRSTSNLNSVFLDDIYFIDTTGSSNNDFLGDSIVEGALPNGAGNSTQWTNDAGSGSNFNNVDDPGGSSPDDTGAGGTNSSDTNTNKDLYAYEDLVQIQGNIHFVQLGTQMAMSAAGSRTVKTKYRDPDTTEADGDTHTVDSTSFDEFTEVFDENPASAAAWDVDDINNGEFGVEVVS